MSDAPTKLTKKQKKAAEFKSAKSGGGPGAGGSKKKSSKRDAEQEDVPENDLAGDDDVGVEADAVAVAEKAAASKKRKREGDVPVAATALSQKEPVAASSSTSSGSGTKISFDENGDAVKKAKTKRRKKAKNDDSEGPRLIVFVGNMSFKTTADKIKDHFKSHCGEEPTVRLLTTKSDHSKLSASKRKSVEKGKAADTTIRSKGCAFVQFTKAPALQKALGLHHTLFEGRLINVELTAGGGGNSEDRQKKIQEKNAKLEQERAKLHEKYWKPQDEQRKATNDEKRQRGEDVGPPKKQARKGDEGEAQWGKRQQTSNTGNTGSGDGKSQQQKPKRMPKWMASGANAVRLQD